MKSKYIVFLLLLVGGIIYIDINNKEKVIENVRIVGTQKIKKEIPKMEIVKTPSPILNKKNRYSDESISKFIDSYSGNQYTDEYLEDLRRYCDTDTLAKVIAISVAETGMGKSTSKQTNYYGWHPNGDRTYDPDTDTMSEVICHGISTKYNSVGDDMNLVKVYTGNDNPTTWSKNYRWALNKMSIN